MKRLSRAVRKKLIKTILKRDGNRCCWCKKSMEIPAYRKPAYCENEMVTVEHYFSKKLGDIHNVALIKLSHKKHNR